MASSLASPLRWIRSRRGEVATIASACGLSTLAIAPVYLLSAVAVLAREDLRIGATELGYAVGAYFAAASVVSVISSPVVDRIGSRLLWVVGAFLVLVGCAAIATIVNSFVVLIVMLIVLGAANAVLQATANMMLAGTVSHSWQGLAFGVKQSALPLSITVAGALVALLSASVNWRVFFAAIAVVAFGVAIFGLCLLKPNGPQSSGNKTVTMLPRKVLVLSVAATAAASASMNALAAFLPSWAFEVGFSVSGAGLLMSISTGLSMALRVLSGWAADRRGGRHMPVICAHLGVGAIGVLAVSSGNSDAIIVGCIAAFALGWSWPGLLLFAMVRLAHGAPGAAASAVQSGAFFGGAVGPAGFGILVSHWGYPTAWRVAAVVIALAALLVFTAGRLTRDDECLYDPR